MVKIKEIEEPEYIITDEKNSVFVGLIAGDMDFSVNVKMAKPFRGQSKFDTLKKYNKNIEQIFTNGKASSKKGRTV